MPLRKVSTCEKTIGMSIKPSLNMARPVYQAGRRIIDACLRSDDSLFTPGRGIWSPAVIGDLYVRFVENPDESSDSFETKFERQLSGAPPETFQLAGEMLFVHFLAAVRGITGETKRQIIKRVLSWSPSPVELPAELLSATEDGIGSPGIAFHTYRPFHLHFLLDFFQSWKRQSDESRQRLLGDPWGFREFVFSLPIRAGQMQREALLHLVHPRSFEPILSQKTKQRIATRFAEQVSNPGENIDKQILEIREKLSRLYGEGFSFYDRQIARQWQTDSSRWSDFVGWGKRFYEWEGFEKGERTYKIEIGGLLKTAMKGLLDGAEGWQDLLGRAFRHRDNNLTSWRMNDRFLTFVSKEPESAADALRALWNHEEELRNRLSTFLSRLPEAVKKGPGSRTKLVSFLLMAVDATQHPICAYTPFAKGIELTGYSPVSKKADDAEIYQHALGFLDEILKQASERGLELRDRLDAQGVLWSVTHYEADWAPVKDWPEEERNAFLRYRGDIEIREEIEQEEPPLTGGVPGSLEELASALFLSEPYLREIDKLLKDKGQLIFYGPPGTGKTYVARELARFYSQGRASAKTIVQFHPSYAYEDFVEGIRPLVADGR
ncbi:MAG: hypothetical protein EHM18_02525, partial [Acidobacteria bacterium]